MVLSTSDTIPKTIAPMDAMATNKQTDEAMQDDFAPVIFDYQDFFYSGLNPKRFRKIAARHVVNHIYKDLAVKRGRTDRTKADSSFTPTTVIVLCPQRLQAYQFITELLNCLPETVDGVPFEVENFDRLAPEYSIEDIPNYLRAKPKDWLDIFAGNTDQNFKMGIRLWNHKIALFQEMAKSQLVIASPLALHQHRAKEAADFLSSVEVLVMDTMDALFMQVWDRLYDIIKGMNKKPSSVDLCDWSRVRKYCLQENHGKMRQNISYGSVLTPEIYGMFASFENKAGSVVVRPLSYPPIVVPGFNNSFVKIAAAKHDDIGDAMWRCFKDKLFPLIKQWRGTAEEHAKRTVIYYVSTARFWQARHELELYDVNFLELSDDSLEGDDKRMKKAFKQDPNAVLLMTERYFFHRRINLGPVGRVVFMEPPTFPQFVGDLCGSGDAIVYFTDFDQMSLERIAGSNNAEHVLNSGMYVL